MPASVVTTPPASPCGSCCCRCPPHTRCPRCPPPRRGIVKPRRAARAIRAAQTARAARQRRHHPRRRHLADRVVACVRHIHIAGAVHRHALGLVEPRRAARAVRAARTARSCPPASSPPPPASPSGSCSCRSPPHTRCPRCPPPRRRDSKPRRAARAIRTARIPRAARQRRHHPRRGHLPDRVVVSIRHDRRCPRCPPPRPKAIGIAPHCPCHPRSRGRPSGQPRSSRHRSGWSG